MRSGNEALVRSGNEALMRSGNEAMLWSLLYHNRTYCFTQAFTVGSLSLR